MPPGGACTINLKATNYASVQLVNLPVYGGVLGCGDPLLNISNPGGPVNRGTGLDPVTGLPVPGWAAGNRGLYDKNGQCIQPVNYTFTNNVLSGNTVNVVWDLNVAPGSALKYTVNWKSEYVGATGMPIQSTKVRWSGLNDPGALIAGRACIAQNQDPVTKDFLPRPYGTLTALIDNVQTSIDVTASVTLPAPPFAITIGGERLLVSAIAGTTWTVVRGDGSTPAASHPASAPVLSNPLPVYYPNGITNPSVQMGMCIADEGFVMVPPGSPDCNTTPSAPTACAVVTTTFYDIGDGSGSRSP